MSDEDKKFWYNSSTGEVEQGLVSPAASRVGPFDTAEEAARAPEILRERSQRWSEEDAAEDSWSNSRDGEQ